MRGIPQFSSEKGQGWHYHRIALENWYASNRLNIYATVIQQKQAVLLSLKGPALCTQELMGTGSQQFDDAATWTAYLDAVQGVFLP